VPAVLYAGVLSIGLGYTGQIVAQQHTSPTHAAIILSLESVFAALSGWLVLGEALAPRQLVGCGLMLAGMLLAQVPRAGGDWA
jgi:drug/metabolite transporter (DMT)-like permease